MKLKRSDFELTEYTLNIPTAVSDALNYEQEQALKDAILGIENCVEVCMDHQCWAVFQIPSHPKGKRWQKEFEESVAQDALLAVCQAALDNAKLEKEVSK